MDFNDLLNDSTRKVADMSAQMLLEKPEFISDFVAILLSDKVRISANAGRVLALCCQEDSSLLQPFIENLAEKWSTLQQVGSRRSLAKIFTLYPPDYSEKAFSILLNTAFNFVESNKESIAVQVYSMDILYQLSTKEPIIKNELIHILENLLEEAQQPAILSRGNKILRVLKKEIAIPK